MTKEFTHVTTWIWHHFFRGDITIMTEDSATEEMVRNYIERDTGRGAGGNYDSSSLVSKIVKMKKKYVKMTDLTK